jgi:hypothetical protein
VNRDVEIARSHATRFASMALAAIQREYPNKILHFLGSEADAKPPRLLTPLFCGAYDWHSAVHGHWTLVRLLRVAPNADFATLATAALEQSFVEHKVAGERRYLTEPGRRAFEMPYGMAWLLQLASELAEWDDPRARRWRETLAPLANLAASRMLDWMDSLPYPVRSGEHSSSAFGFAFFLDWAKRCNDAAAWERAKQRVLELYANDRDGPLHLEPSGYDFLSACLAEADLMRRVLQPDELAAFLTRFLPTIPGDAEAVFLEPVVCPDPSDPKLSHLDGLNLSRAWMLDGIARGLPATDPRRAALVRAFEAHRNYGLAHVSSDHFAGSHWQASFAVYLATSRAP